MNRNNTRSAVAACGFAASPSTIAASASAPNPPPAQRRKSRRDENGGTWGDAFIALIHKHKFVQIQYGVAQVSDRFFPVASPIQEPAHRVALLGDRFAAQRQSECAVDDC